MKVRSYTPADAGAVWTLWQAQAPAQGYAPLSRQRFARLVLGNPYFSPRYAFVLEQGGAVQGFVCGAASSKLPAGAERGYFSCLLPGPGGEWAAGLLLGALEGAFTAAGRVSCDALFFNPIRLPWVIPGTPGHTHNNAPGVWVEAPIYDWMLARGYAERTRECAMYLRLGCFALPERQLYRQQGLAGAGYEVAFYDPARHTGLDEMLAVLGNQEWQAEIGRCAAQGQPFLVAALRGRAVGFAGPVRPEPGGRGYFTGIGVTPAHEGRGLGTLLFYRLCLAEQQAGAQYMSLFTGENNPARRIYESAGFAPVRSFAVLRKPLGNLSAP